MSPIQGRAGALDASMDNPYIRAYRRVPGEAVFRTGASVSSCLGSPTLRDYSVFRKQHRTPRQQEITLRQSRFLSEQNLIRSSQFERGTKIFLLGVTPTVGQLIDHTCAVRTQLPTPHRPLGNSMAVAHAEQAARQSVFHELSTLTANGSYGSLSKDKPDNVVRLMYENFSSLSLFVEGPKKHVKIRQLNKIITDYSVDVIAGCETRTDWRYVNKEESRFANLF